MSHTENSERFLVLEGIRGLCALLVATHHIENIPTYREVYLAVDMFFLLSGFVIAHAYERELASGALSFCEFMLLRVIRLYPLNGLGLLVVVLVLLVGTPHTWHDIWPDAALAAFGIPNFTSLYLFPLNLPTWSLFFEMIAYVAFALAAGRLGPRAMAAVLATAFAALILSGWYNPAALDLGVSPSQFHGGLTRVAFSFTLGVIIFRLYRARWSGRLTSSNIIGALLPLPVLLIILLASVAERRLLFDLLAVAVVFPATLIAAVQVQVTGLVAQAMKLLGIVSYPIYVLHVPVALALYKFYPLATGAAFPQAYPASGYSVLAIAVAVALAAHYWFDVPVRRWLKGRISAARPSTAA